jgi:hypothetical protein
MRAVRMRTARGEAATVRYADPLNIGLYITTSLANRTQRNTSFR